MKPLTPAQLFILFAVMLWAAAGQAQTPHSATFSITNPGCTTTNLCTVQIWAAVIPSGNCPAVGNAAYSEIVNALIGSATATSTAWSYVDTRTSLVSGAIYCSYETATFNAGGGPSGASAIFQGTIPTPQIAVPNAPTGTVTLK